MNTDLDFPSKWRNEIITALEQGEFKIDYYNRDSHNKEVLEWVAYNKKHYEYLDELGLVNRGFCPLTGESITEDFCYHIFGRKVFLSAKGQEICQAIRNQKHKENYGEDYSQLVQRKHIAKSRANLTMFIIAVVSFVTSFKIIDPSGFFSYAGFALLGFVLFRLMIWFYIMVQGKIALYKFQRNN